MARRSSGGRSQDHYGRRARAEGFAARSVYKLDEINTRLKLFRRGQRVLDLGAYPGSWMQYVLQHVGKEGRVLGLDIQNGQGPAAPNCEYRVADVLEIDIAELGGENAFDVVISDMAPSTTGHRATDQARSFALFMRAVEIAEAVLAPQGHFVGKIFQGGDFPEAKKRVGMLCETVKIVRPKATRSQSFECFIVGLRRKPVATGE